MDARCRRPLATYTDAETALTPDQLATGRKKYSRLLREAAR